MSKTILAISVLIGSLLSTASLWAEETLKADIKLLPEITIGQENAPVTVIEYTSMTCPHCADFHLRVLPEIQKEYVEKGEVKIIHRDYPGDGLSLKATQLAFCGGPQLHQKMVTIFFQTQERWMFANDPENELKKIACENGLTKQQVTSCLQNTDLMDQIIRSRQDGQKKYNIAFTPTLIINGKIIPQGLSFDEFQRKVDPLLSKDTPK